MTLTVLCSRIVSSLTPFLLLHGIVYSLIPSLFFSTYFLLPYHLFSHYFLTPQHRLPFDIFFVFFSLISSVLSAFFHSPILIFYSPSLRHSPRPVTCSVRGITLTTQHLFPGNCRFKGGDGEGGPAHVRQLAILVHRAF